MEIRYKDAVTPTDYKCNGCGTTGAKLWRQYQTVQSDLLCAPCVLKDQNELGTFDAEGCRFSKLLGEKTDQCGWYVPAIPDEEGHGYWGYSSVPPEGVKWWRDLPTYVEAVSDEQTKTTQEQAWQAN